VNVYCLPFNATSEPIVRQISFASRANALLFLDVSSITSVLPILNAQVDTVFLVRTELLLILSRTVEDVDLRVTVVKYALMENVSIHVPVASTISNVEKARFVSKKNVF
jgi:hypothetical protein